MQTWLLTSALICPENISAFFWYQPPPPASVAPAPQVIEKVVYVQVPATAVVEAAATQTEEKPKSE